MFKKLFIISICFVIWRLVGGFDWIDDSIACYIIQDIHLVSDTLINSDIKFHNTSLGTQIDTYLNVVSNIKIYTIDEAMKITWEALKHKSFDSDGFLKLNISSAEYSKNIKIFEEALLQVKSLIKQIQINNILNEK